MERSATKTYTVKSVNNNMNTFLLEKVISFTFIIISQYIKPQTTYQIVLKMERIWLRKEEYGHKKQCFVSVTTAEASLKYIIKIYMNYLLKLTVFYQMSLFSTYTYSAFQSKAVYLYAVILCLYSVWEEVNEFCYQWSKNLKNNFYYKDTFN